MATLLKLVKALQPMNNGRDKLLSKASTTIGKPLAVIALSVSLAAHAGVYTFSSGSLSQAIPDNSPSGVAYNINFTDTGLQVTDIKVSLSISGGWNGDLYAYLSHGSQYAILLNRVGTTTSGSDGYGTSGLNILLEPATTHPGLLDIHTVPSPSSLPTAYAADGRTVYYDEASRTQTLDLLLGSGVDPNGTWTLFFADRAAVNTSTLTGWSLEITAVPEPVNTSLVCFAGASLAIYLHQSRRVRRMLRQSRR
jgi:subtilisin-like proprotein convertase family protein